MKEMRQLVCHRLKLYRNRNRWRRCALLFLQLKIRGFRARTKANRCRFRKEAPSGEVIAPGMSAKNRESGDEMRWAHHRLFCIGERH